MTLPDLTDNSSVFAYFMWIWWLYYSKEAIELYGVEQ